jgi:hypothetical protein
MIGFAEFFKAVSKIREIRVQDQLVDLVITAYLEVYQPDITAEALHQGVAGIMDPCKYVYLMSQYAEFPG